MSTKILIQARSSSTRLPGKIFKQLDIGLSVLETVYYKCSSLRDSIVIIPFGDEETHTYCVQRNLPYFEGDLKDLVDRHYQAAKTYLASNVVRITSDCPMFSEAALMYMLYCHEKNELDFTTNFTTCADGHDIDIYSMKLLTYLHKNSKEREHVSLDLKLDIEKTCSEWKTLVYKEFYDKSWFPKISIDTQEDFDRVNQLLNQRVVHVVPKATGKLN